VTDTETARTWTLELPPGTPILSANHRMHRYAAARRIKELNAAAILLTRVAKLPVIGRATVLVLYLPPPRLKRDRHPLASDRIEDSENLAPTSKAVVDGLVRGGVFASDSRKYVPRVAYEVLAETHPRGLVRIVITEAPK
jgi:crossover junction endodeoxyribonuclease RusA